MTRVLTLTLVSLLFVLELSPFAQEERTPRFALAVLRRDALAVPFAAFNGSRWSTPWPANTTHDLPISLTDVPERWWGTDAPPRDMSLWSEGKRTGTVGLTGVATLPLMCQARTIVKTDYKPSLPPPPPIERPYPKEGLLVSGDVGVRPITILDRASSEAQQLVPLLTSEFNQSESDAIRNFTNWRHPLGSRDRRRLPITIEAVYRAESDEPGWTAYFVEAVREYKPGPEDTDGCGLVTFASGWVMRGPRDESKSRLGAVVTYCDRKGVVYMLPFGLITAREKVYWVYQLSGFESEWYEVARPMRGRTESHALYHVGSCR